MSLRPPQRMKIRSFPIVILNPVLSSVLRFDKLTNRGALAEYILSAAEGSKGGAEGRNVVE